VKVQGEFTWHTHPDTNEFFLVLDGQVTIPMCDRDVVLRPRDLFVVPRGTEHCPRADTETALLLFEPSDVVNTGDACGELTAEVEPLALPPGESPVTPPARTGGPYPKTTAARLAGGARRWSRYGHEH
jgi:quercetin dioxygenase-like cupin family protein